MGGEVETMPEFGSKDEMYAWLERQTELLVADMSRKFTPDANCTTGLANVAALCFYALNQYAARDAPLRDLPVNWFGFYLLQAPGMLALGPFQGRPACTQIRVGRGVCGTAADADRTLVVEDVHAFPGHIACDSASAAEVVVPLHTENGSVAGVIDVDSTVAGHFTAEDGAGLERVAAVLSRHLTFPMSRALAVNPSLAFAPPSGTPAAAPADTAALSASAAPAAPAAHPPTKVSRIPFFTVEPAQPATTTKEVGGWDLSVTRLERIMTQPEQEALQADLGVGALPEIAFAANAFRAGPHGAPPLLDFDLRAALRSAAAFYATEEFRTRVGPQLQIPAAEAWGSAPYGRHDPGVDWAWRSDFFGLARGELAPLPAAADGINWELLQDRTLPIVFYDNFQIFEDDLHDNGVAKLTVKFRAMNEALFVLLRHLVRVDRHALWVREVRVYHEFGKTSAAAAAAAAAPMPHVVFNEQVRTKPFEALPEDWRELTDDELCRDMETIKNENFLLVSLD